MSMESLFLVRVLEGLGLIAGLSIVYFASKAYSKSHLRPMVLLALAFLLITMASVVEGVLFEIYHFDVFDARAFRSAVMLGGLIAVLAAIYQTK